MNEIPKKDNKDSKAVCFLCGDMVEIKYSKRQKPYLVCNDCGVQVFIRGLPGINRLEKWKSISSSQIKLESQPAKTLALVGQLAHLKEQLKIAKENANALSVFFDEDPSVEAIEKEIETIENQLRNISKQPRN
jgi:hypothetical protein